MTGVAGPVEAGADAVEYRTTSQPCVMCMTTRALHDEEPKLGTVRWRISPYFSLRRGTAVNFTCPQGHSSDEDPRLLKAFPSRTFGRTNHGGSRWKATEG